MVKLNFPYGAGDPTPVLADDAPLVQRELPDRTKIKDVTFDPDCSHGDRDASSAKLLRVRRRTERRHAHPRVQLQRHGQNFEARPERYRHDQLEDGIPTCPVVFNAPTSRIRIGDISY